MLKKDELTNPNSCLNRASDDEPLFVLRAQDVFAAAAIKEWAQLYRQAHAPGNKWDSEEHHAKYEEAMTCADKFDTWEGRKIPD
jgi:hypothetical protein